jgi:DNA-binding LacI/PurR family transcriptional regulator
MKQTTLVDIAKRLQISPSTVSRALSDHPDIKEDTKELVRKLAKELRYSPNPIAQSLKRSQTTTIGVIVPEIKHDFFASAISGIEEVAYQSGFTIIVCQSNESFEREVVNTNVLMHHRVAGVIVSISQNTKDCEHFQDLIRQKIPLVFFDRACDDVLASKVVIDDFRSAYEAVTHLVGRGYKRIAHFAGPRELAICRKRLEGYLEALRQANFSEATAQIVYGGLDEHDGYRALDSVLKQTNIPDAVFCVNDPVAIGAFQRIKEAGLSIPGDIALVGFSNNEITSLIDPPMTTVNQPRFEMGRKAAELLVKAIEEKVIEPSTVVLEAKLIVRGST